MFAIVGLGNPGSRYSETRHNVGFRVIERFVQEFIDDRRKLSWEKKFGNRFVRTTIAGEDCLLIQPQKYMNLSGETSVILLRYFRVESNQLIVVHDDLDLAPGTLRLRRGGSSGGHRGVENIIAHWGRTDFVRLRIGIGHPRRTADDNAPGADSRAGGGTLSTDDDSVTAWVLGKPTEEEKALIGQTAEQAVQAIRVLIAQGLESAQRQFNRTKMPPQDDETGQG